MRLKIEFFVYFLYTDPIPQASCRPLSGRVVVSSIDSARAIKDAASATASGRPIPSDVWAAHFARRSQTLEVPLISMKEMGFHTDDEDDIISDDLGYLDCGREAMAWADQEHKCVYKFFDLKIDEHFQGSIGLKLLMQGRPPDEVEVIEQPGRIDDILEKICALHSAGACPTEIAGLTDDGKYLVAKQPRCVAMVDFKADRDRALKEMNAVAPKGSFGRELWVFYAEGRFWLLSDLHAKNILRLQDGTPAIIDALTGHLPDYYRRFHPKLEEASQRAKALALGEEFLPTIPSPMSQTTISEF